jgi:hypothetical protein
MLSVTSKPFMQSYIMLNVIVLSVVMLNVAVLNAGVLQARAFVTVKLFDDSLILVG